MNQDTTQTGVPDNPAPGEDRLEGEALALWSEGRKAEAIALLEQRIALEKQALQARSASVPEGDPGHGEDPAVSGDELLPLAFPPATLETPASPAPFAVPAPELDEHPTPVADPGLDKSAPAVSPPEPAGALEPATVPAPLADGAGREIAGASYAEDTTGHLIAGASAPKDTADPASANSPQDSTPESPARSEVSRRTWPRRAVSVAAALTLFLMVGLGAWVAWGLHRIDLNQPPNARPQVLLEAADGTPINRAGGSYAGPVTRAEIPEHLVQAVVATEDRRFYEHIGLDPIGIVRAAWRNVRAGGVVEGGSTITQQLTKVLFLSPEQTLRRKLQEAVIATWLDLRLSKDEILTEYLDSIYFGAGATGISAAAKIYFDKPVRDLDLAELAMLAGLIRSPSKLSPLADIDAAQERAGVVLNAMVDAGSLSRADALAAVLRPATPVRNSAIARTGSWFGDWVADSTAEAMGPLAGAARIRTTLQPRLQAMAENAVRAGLERDGEPTSVQAALIAMTPDGAVVALVGGRSYSDTQFNRAVSALRRPGSAFALPTYLAALRLGWKPDDTVVDAPIDIAGWQPENVPERYLGEVTLQQAFTLSLEAATIQLAQDIGIENVIEAARDLGIDADLPSDLTTAAGAVEMSLLDLTGAYASVAAGRLPVEPWSIAGVADEAEPPKPSKHTLPARALDRQEELRRLLAAAVTDGAARAAALDGFTAGNPGISQGYRDGWFIGFTDTLVAGVWVGNDDNAPLEQSAAAKLPAAIWQDFMGKATGLAPAKPQSEVSAEVEEVAATENEAPAPPAPTPDATVAASTPQTEPAGADKPRSATVAKSQEAAKASAAKPSAAPPRDVDARPLREGLAKRRAQAEDYVAKRRAEAERRAGIRRRDTAPERPRLDSERRIGRERPAEPTPTADDGPRILLGGRGIR